MSRKGAEGGRKGGGVKYLVATGCRGGIGYACKGDAVGYVTDEQNEITY